MRPIRLAPAAVWLLFASGAALAHPGGWGGSGWGGPGWGEPAWGHTASAAHNDPREGRLQVSRFRAEGIDLHTAFGHGAIALAEMGEPGPHAEGREEATFEAAVIDQLARAGYDTADAHAAAASPQLAELRVLHSEVAPGDPPHRPVSGAMTMGVSNRGSMLGMAIAVDATKPRGPLIATRLEVRIKDRASGKALWEGSAEIVTREGDPHWDDGKLAARLAGALFDGFPLHTDDLALR